ncbi:MAG: hypothetical protein PHH28_08100 [Desulfuromonadaceae bacterium]|nr:hypothetical protein [Desulfuromonadaceae bacterium]
MPQLKQSFIKEISDAIDRSCFTLADFQVEFPDSGSTLMKIFFKYNNNYRFIVYEKAESETINIKEGYSVMPKIREEKRKWVTTYLLEAPSDYKAVDEEPIYSLDEIPKKIPQWCVNIHKELSIPINSSDNFEKFREELEELIKNDIDDETAKFNPDEIENLAKKIDSLFEKFEELKERNVLTEAELKKVKEQLEEVKSSSKTYPKGVWARVTNNRLIRIIVDFTKSKEGRELITDGIKEMLK